MLLELFKDAIPAPQPIAAACILECQLDAEAEAHPTTGSLHAGLRHTGWHVPDQTAVFERRIADGGLTERAL
jgi:hypothetical protein